VDIKIIEVHKESAAVLTQTFISPLALIQTRQQKIIYLLLLNKKYTTYFFEAST